ncbi:hypothetical protein ACM26W_01210 [Halomonas sp. HK25]|uniref:hypothetical protein n=1 Tax=Halomonas sp. HK25 TaxID=3394321 RepID=UPI0039FC19FF
MLKPKSAVAITAMATALAGCGPSLDLTADQQEFVTLVEASMEAYGDAENSIQEGRAREERAERLCAHFADGFEVHGWQGEVDDIHSTNTGHAGIEILIAKNLTLKTASSAMTLSSAKQQTLIEEDSPLFETVASLENGDTVSFSGAFLDGSDKDCLKEESVTQRGGMTMPEFLFHVTDLEKAGG